MGAKISSLREWAVERFAMGAVLPRERLGSVFRALAVFVLMSGALAFIQFGTPNLVGNDGYYHIKMAALMGAEGLTPTFEWLPLTVLNPAEFVDHHFLFHILLIPFTWAFDLLLAAKVATVVFAALALTVLWWLLRAQHVPYAGLWAAGLWAVSQGFLYRMNMPRAQSLSLLMLVLGVHWILQGHHRRLLPLAFLYVWLYNAFPLLLAVAAAYALATRLPEGRWAWRPLVWVAAGIALGLVVNPYFPENLLFVYRHLAPKLSDATALSVGSEWYPYKTTQLMENAGLALLVFLSGVVALGLHEKRMDAPTAMALFLALGFGGMLFQSRRFVEYAPPFWLLFAALTWSPLLRNAAARWRRWLPAAGIFVLVPFLWLSLAAARKDLQKNTASYARYAEASAWLVENTPAGSRVFQTDWDDFPRLFYYNTHNIYTIGLDPSYMQLYDADLYAQWVAITRGDLTPAGEVIAGDYGADFALTDLRHKGFLRAAAQDETLVEVYRDEYAVIFQVLP
ncbi:MAG: hypothetical protein D6802_00340 [Ardenticatenia bacterium]|nr:MAG: hypothetical protein D6802_00340 [Ardenticatenia bacterium]